MSKVPKNKICISLQYLQKSMVYEIDILAADKHKKNFYKLIVSLWVCMATHAQSIRNNNFIIFLQYLKENVKDGVDFSLLIIVKGFFKMILPFFICVARHAQITQNKKFAISLQYLKKEVNDEVDFWYAGKYENLLQIDTMILMEMVKHFQSSQNSNFIISQKRRYIVCILSV